MDQLAGTGGSGDSDAADARQVSDDRRSSSTTSAVWFAILGVVLGGVAPATFLQASPLAAGVSNAWVWAVVLVVAVGLRLAWLIANDPRRVFEIVFWLFTYVFMGLAALVQIRTDRYPETTKFIDTALNPAAFAIVGAGCLAFAAGSFFAGGRAHLHPSDVIARISPHRVTVLSFIALLAASYYVAKMGIGTLTAARDRRTDVEAALWPNFTISAIVRAAATLPLVVAFAGLMRLRRERKAVGRSGPTVLPWIVVIVALRRREPDLLAALRARYRSARRGRLARRHPQRSAGALLHGGAGGRARVRVPERRLRADHRPGGRPPVRPPRCRPRTSTRSTR